MKYASASKKKPLSFKLAHISDLHLASLQGIHARQLLNKRILGYAKWHISRKAKTDTTIARILIDNLHEIKPDHTVITGDLTHLGLPDEFTGARKWLEKMGPPENISLVPGNHDTYVREAWDTTFLKWMKYLKPQFSFRGSCIPRSLDDIFPTLEIIGPIALIGISTAVPCGPHLATGMISRDQLEKLQNILQQLGGRDLFRTLFLHHPPVAGVVKKRKALVNHAALERIIKTYGCELVLHGHSHKTTCSELKTSRGKAIVTGAPSITSAVRSNGKESAWFLYHITQERAKTFSLITERYVFNHSARRFEVSPADTFKAKILV